MSAWATSSENTGVVAFRIEPRPPDNTVSPQKISANGTRLLSTPMLPKARHIAADRERGVPRARNTSASAAAARATRTSTTVSGGSAATVIFAKKNAPQQRQQREQAPSDR